MGEGEVWLFCKDAPNLVATLERAVYDERTKTSRISTVTTLSIDGSGPSTGSSLRKSPRLPLPCIRSVAFANPPDDHEENPRDSYGGCPGLSAKKKRSTHEKLRLRDSGFVAVTSSTESIKTHGVHDFPKGSKCPCRISVADFSGNSATARYWH